MASLSETNPELGTQWHPSKNGDVTSQDVIAGTSRKIWWLCDLGHEWQASGNARVVGSACPPCARNILTTGVNDLATVNPTLAEQWHPKKMAR